MAIGVRYAMIGDMEAALRWAKTAQNYEPDNQEIASFIAEVSSRVQ